MGQRVRRISHWSYRGPMGHEGKASVLGERRASFSAKTPPTRTYTKQGYAPECAFLPPLDST